MTGYAAKSFVLQHDNRSTEITITLKSLNSRFFEVFFKLPPVFFPYEIEINKIIKERLVRGSVQCIVSSNNADFFQETIVPSINTARAYYNALNTIKHSLNITSSITLDQLARMPNLFTTTDRVLSEEQKDLFLIACNKTIDDLITRRKAEGDALKKDILSRLVLINDEMNHIKKLFVAKILDQKKRVQETLQEIQADESILASSQRTALYTMLDKLDLQEEVTRFENHHRNMIKTIEMNIIEKGKQLDFTVQEMLRENNTMLAKCNDSEISTRAITVKVELEKIREQIQNIV